MAKKKKICQSENMSKETKTKSNVKDRVILLGKYGQFMKLHTKDDVKSSIVRDR